MKTPYGIITITLLLLTISETVNAQQSTFTKVFYDNYGSAQAYAIVNSFDSNYMVAGEKDEAGLLLKMDPEGVILWDKKYESTLGNYFFDIVATKDSNFIMVGYHRIPVTYDRDILCVKVNQEGDTLWAKTIDHGKNEYAMTIQQTNDEGFILSGYGEQNVAPQTFIIVDKLDPDGNLEWSQSFEACNFYHHASSIIQTPDSGYIVTFFMETYPSFEFIPVLMKLTPAGNVDWSVKYTGSSVSHAYGSDVIFSGDGLIFCILTDYGIVLMKTDLSGNVLWSKINPGQFVHYSLESMMLKMLCITNNDYAILHIGDMSSGGELIKADSAGNFLWRQDLSLFPSDVIETDDRGLIVLGNGPLMGIKLAETYNPQIGVIKTDSLGNSSECVYPGSSVTDTITSILVPVSVTSTPGGTQSSVTILTSDAGLLAYSGCVEMVPGVKEINRERNIIQVYPNPSNGRIQMKISLSNEPDLKSIRIYDVTGKCIYQSDDPNSFYSGIDIATAPDGIYFAKVVFRDWVCTKMFTINH
jgi:hypothetical protein